MGSIVQYVIKESGKIWELRGTKLFILLTCQNLKLTRLAPNEFNICSTDLRTDGWPLADSPMTLVLLCFAYLFMVKVWGPKFMESRKPFQFQNVMIAYNAFQIVLNGWLFCEIC